VGGGERERGQKQETSVRKAVQHRREPYLAGSPAIKWSWRIGTAVTAWGRRMEVGAPEVP